MTEYEQAIVAAGSRQCELMGGYETVILDGSSPMRSVAHGIECRNAVMATEKRVQVSPDRLC